MRRWRGDKGRRREYKSRRREYKELSEKKRKRERG